MMKAYVINFEILKENFVLNKQTIIWTDFGLTYCSNGDLLSLIKKSSKFSVPMTEFYAAEIVSGLEYMHEKKVIHR